jgi:hypothetical protein
LFSAFAFILSIRRGLCNAHAEQLPVSTNDYRQDCEVAKEIPELNAALWQSIACKVICAAIRMNALRAGGVIMSIQTANADVPETGIMASRAVKEKLLERSFR